MVIGAALMLQACAILPQKKLDAVPVVAEQIVESQSVAAPEAMSPSGSLATPAIAKPTLMLKSLTGQAPKLLPSNPPTDAVAFWLAEAGWAFNVDKLTTPKADNAYYYLSRVLAKEPYNRQALAALEQIVERYCALLQASLDQGKVDQARVFWSRAKQVIPQHSQLKAKLRLINKHKKSLVKSSQEAVFEPKTKLPMMRNQRLTLPLKLIDEEDQRLAQWLVMVAQKAQNLQATMLIVAPKDAQARWIYQTMNAADADQRIRANIKHSQPARLEVRYLARKDKLEVYSHDHYITPD